MRNCTAPQVLHIKQKINYSYCFYLHRNCKQEIANRSKRTIINPLFQWIVLFQLIKSFISIFYLSFSSL